MNSLSLFLMGLGCATSVLMVSLPACAGAHIHAGQCSGRHAASGTACLSLTHAADESVKLLML